MPPEDTGQTGLHLLPESSSSSSAGARYPGDASDAPSACRGGRA